MEDWEHKQEVYNAAERALRAELARVYGDEAWRVRYDDTRNCVTPELRELLAVSNVAWHAWIDASNRAHGVGKYFKPEPKPRQASPRRADPAQLELF